MLNFIKLIKSLLFAILFLSSFLKADGLLSKQNKTKNYTDKIFNLDDKSIVYDINISDNMRYLLPKDRYYKQTDDDFDKKTGRFDFVDNDYLIQDDNREYMQNRKKQDMVDRLFMYSIIKGVLSIKE